MVTAEEVKIRPARRADREMIGAIMREYGLRDPDPNTFLWVLNHPEVNVLVAVDRVDKPIGMICLSHRPQLSALGRIAHIDELMVSAAVRGIGIGTKLIAAAINRAKGLSACRVELSASLAKGAVDPSYFTKRGFTLFPVAIMRYAQPL